MANYKYRFSDADFIKAVETSFSNAEVFRKLGLAYVGAARRVFLMRVEKLGISTAHFTGQAWLKGKTHQRYDLKDVLIANSPKQMNDTIKKRLIKEGILPYECSICGLKNSWQHKPITLQLDHINGHRMDHRIENLRLLCPNCHSQTDTFCSRNNHKYSDSNKNPEFAEQKSKTCEICKLPLKYNRAKYCKQCYYNNINLIRPPCKTKITWPSVKELKSRLKNTTLTALGKELGVSRTAIQTYIKRNSK